MLSLKKYLIFLTSLSCVIFYVISLQKSTNDSGVTEMLFNEKKFWEIQESGSRSSFYEETKAIIYSELSKLSKEEVIEYQKIFTDKYYSLYTYDLFAVSKFAIGMADESFNYFRLWLLFRGKDYYELALNDPDSLGVLLTSEDDEEAKSEFWGYLGSEYFYDEFNEDFPDVLPSHPETLHNRGDKEWYSIEELKVKFPKTWEVVKEYY